MGKAHSKAEKSPSFVIKEKITLSPRQKRGKLKKENERKKQGKNTKMGGLTLRSQLDLNPREIMNENDFEVEIKRHMQDQLAFNSDIFVLNQMMLSVQFFANYERLAYFLIIYLFLCVFYLFESYQSLLNVNIFVNLHLCICL